MSTHTQHLSALTRASVRTTILPQVFLTEEYMAIAMEYAAGGDMFQLVVRQRGLPEADARWYFQQLIIAIDYCHRMVRLLCNASLLQSQMQVPFPVTHHSRSYVRFFVAPIEAELSTIQASTMHQADCMTYSMS